MSDDAHRRTGELRALIAVVRRRWVRQGRPPHGRPCDGRGRRAGARRARGRVPDRRRRALPLVLLAVAAGRRGSRGGGAGRRSRGARASTIAGSRGSSRSASRTLPGDRALDDALVSALDAAGQTDYPGRAAFLPLLLEDAVRRLRAIDPGEIVTPESMRGAAGRAAAGGAPCWPSRWSSSAPTFGRALETARLRFFPGSVRVDVRAGERARSRRHAAAHSRRRCTASAGSLKHFTPSLIVAAGGERADRADDARRRRRSSSRFESVDRTFTYTRDRGVRPLGRLHRHGAVPAARRADRPALRVSVVCRARAARRAGRRRHLRAGRHARAAPHPHRQADRAGGDCARRAAGRARACRGRPHASKRISCWPRDDSYRVRLADADGLRSSGDTRILHPADGRSSAGRPHPPAVRRSADHAARGSRHRSARRRRLRHRRLRPGVRRGRRPGAGRAVRPRRAAPASRRSARGCCRPRTSASSPGTSSPTTRGRATSAAASGRRERRATSSFSR